MSRGGVIEIDGAYGEGGGQLLRTALSLAAVTGQAFRLEHVRARRSKPGLRAQHLAAVHATAELCDAELTGAALDSRTLTFVPRREPHPGDYQWDVGTAGATTLIFQAILWPLALCSEPSTIALTGGTHVAWSPPADYVREVYLPTLSTVTTGVLAEVNADLWGWYPRGGGLLRSQIHAPTAIGGLHLLERGSLREVSVLSAASNLPQHITDRQAGRADFLLRKQGIVARIEKMVPPSPGQGTMVFVLAEYEHARAGFTAYGRIRKPAEEVAEEACRAFVHYHRHGQPVDEHLADQLLLPLALARGASEYAVSSVTQHLLTNAWLIGQFLGVEVRISGEERQPGTVAIQV
jgi:RNA 3'-terminal phosphate cyclase (ATP)